MRTTVDIPNDAYLLAKELAKQKHMSLGNFIAEVLMDRYRPETPTTDLPMFSEAGFPLIYSDHVITSEEVRQFLDEEE